jgi:serine palmitoyltransferase
MEMLMWVRDFPGLYKEWWWNLVMKDPLHVAVETTLLCSMVFMILSRSTEGYKDQDKEKLTVSEKEELLREWKQQRAPLAPQNDKPEQPPVVVHKQDGKWLTIQVQSKKSKSGLKKVLNFCNFDFLGMQTSAVINEASEAALKKYGCGSCGPRGFYGTIDTHLQLEHAISDFTKTDGAIMYSDGASTCSSTVAAFAKRGDILVVDEGVYEPLATGVYLSRANVHWFRHNDMEDLERVLAEIQQTNNRLGRKANAQRRFIVVEGLYKNLGTVAALDKIVELKHKYHYRLILDESFSFGVLGETGRGALEHFHKRPMFDAEIITIALENSLGSIGGVTVGNEEVVDHQRLSGAGYCFSASAPPFTASAAVASLNYLEANPQIPQQLQSNTQYFYQLVVNQLATNHKLVVTSDERSPIVVLQLEQESKHEADIMSEIMQECLDRGVAIVATGQDSSSHKRTELAPAIRITVSSLHTKEDMEKASKALVESAKVVCERYPLEE